MQIGSLITMYYIDKNLRYPHLKFWIVKTINYQFFVVTIISSRFLSGTWLWFNTMNLRWTCRQPKNWNEWRMHCSFFVARWKDDLGWYLAFNCKNEDSFLDFPFEKCNNPFYLAMNFISLAEIVKTTVKHL